MSCLLDRNRLARLCRKGKRIIKVIPGEGPVDNEKPRRGGPGLGRVDVSFASEKASLVPLVQLGGAVQVLQRIIIAQKLSATAPSHQ